jgi:hypothetical protein
MQQRDVAMIARLFSEFASRSTSGGVGQGTPESVPTGLAQQAQDGRESFALAEQNLLELSADDFPDDLTLDDIFDREETQQIQDAFSGATGVASIITYPDGRPFTRP